MVIGIHITNCISILRDNCAIMIIFIGINHRKHTLIMLMGYCALVNFQNINENMKTKYHLSFI